MAHVAILGGGPAGYVAAVRARQLGAEVTLVEMEALGGTCLNRGCIPSKALLRSSELIRLSQRLDEFGVEAEFRGVDWPQVLRRKNQVVSHVVRGVEHLMKHNGIRVVEGRGRLADARTILADTGGKEEAVEADRVVLATGSVPARLPLPGFDDPGVLSSSEMLDIEEVPESLAVIGGGYVGVELADVFSAAGAEVTIIELMPHIVPTEDEEIAAELARAFRRRRIKAHVNARVTEAVKKGGQWRVRFVKDEKEEMVEAAAVLSAVGRWPNTEGMGLAELGIEMEGRAVKVNGRMETSVPGVYACGDAIGGVMLAHVAFAEGKAAAANAVGREVEMDYSAIPSVVYSHPEIGSTGLTEEKARAEGIDVKVGKFSFRASAKARAEGEHEGLVKIVVDAGSGRIVGGQICGPHATDLIHEIVLAVRLGATARQVGEMIHAHPTLMEPIMEAAEDALGMAIHK